MERKKEMIFNEGCWYCIQELIYRGNYDDARALVNTFNLSKYEMRRCQKKTEFLDNVMYDFINSCK